MIACYLLVFAMASVIHILGYEKANKPVAKRVIGRMVHVFSKSKDRENEGEEGEEEGKEGGLWVRIDGIKRRKAFIKTSPSKADNEIVLEYIRLTEMTDLIASLKN